MFLLTSAVAFYTEANRVVDRAEWERPELFPHIAAGCESSAQRAAVCDQTAEAAAE